MVGRCDVDNRHGRTNESPTAYKNDDVAITARNELGKFQISRNSD